MKRESDWKDICEKILTNTWSETMKINEEEAGLDCWTVLKFILEVREVDVSKMKV
jgi:hypothetical protein